MKGHLCQKLETNTSLTPLKENRQHKSLPKKQDRQLKCQKVGKPKVEENKIYLDFAMF